MPFEVYPVDDGYSARSEGSQHERSREQVASEIKGIYEQVDAAGGQIIAGHVVQQRCYDDVPIQVLYLIADIPDPLTTHPGDYA